MIASKIVSYGLAAAVAVMLVVTVVGSTGALLSPEPATADQRSDQGKPKP